jgi:enoyl-CoA hydratase/methylglutaconyl-CoA hydratase
VSETAQELVHLEVADQVATITLDSPHNRNALSRQLVTELFERLEAAEADPEAKVVVIRSSGRVFCSGADLSEAATVGMEEGSRAMVRMQRQVAALGKPVVTVLAGPVRAGGIGLVAASDIAIAAEEANFALTEVKLGLAPAVISLTVLPRLTSRAAAYTFLTGATFGGAEAAEMGLVTRAVPGERLEEEVRRVTDQLVTGAPQGLAETKALLARDLVARIDAGGEEMATLSARLFGSEAAREAMTAFLTRKG